MKMYTTVRWRHTDRVPRGTVDLFAALANAQKGSTHQMVFEGEVTEKVIDLVGALKGLGCGNIGVEQITHFSPEDLLGDDGTGAAADAAGPPPENPGTTDEEILDNGEGEMEDGGEEEDGELGVRGGDPLEIRVSSGGQRGLKFQTALIAVAAEVGAGNHVHWVENGLFRCWPQAWGVVEDDRAKGARVVEVCRGAAEGWKIEKCGRNGEHEAHLWPSFKKTDARTWEKLCSGKGEE